MAYVETSVFIDLCHECSFNAIKINEKLKQLNPSPHHRPSLVENRIANFRRKGLLPLESGNSVSKAEILKGTSTLYDDSGNIKMQWVKSDAAKEQVLEAFSQAIEGILTRVTPSKQISSPAISNKMKDLMSVYTIGDAHVGMLSWKPETGESYDLEIAEQRHIAAMELLVAQSAPTKEAFIIDVGDFFHSDNANNTTAHSGNHLDVDGRYAKVLEIGLALTTKLIDLALQKHEVVRWRSAIGNHNSHSALMMNMFIKAFYRDNPRVIVHDTPNMVMYHQFGKNLIGVTHGHTIKAEKLGEVMSVDCEDIWSSTKFRYFYTGYAAA